MTTKNPKKESKRPDLLALSYVFLGVLLAVAFGFWLQNNSQVQSQADQVPGYRADLDDLSRAGITYACPDPKAATLCAKSKEVQQKVIQGAPGASGAPGRGISGTVLANGHLYVTYTDGKTEDKGIVAGKNGKDGKDGKDGKSITATSISTTGHLILTYSDDSNTDVGVVVGRNGADGRSVMNTTITSDFQLVVNYSDGSSQIAGPLPPGPKGDTGDTGAPGADGISVTDVVPVRDENNACVWVVSFSDGSKKTHPANDSACPPPPETTTEPPPSSGDTLPVPNGG